MGKVYKVVTTILLVLMIALVAVMILPKLFGIQPIAVLSGSMEPTYHVGSMIYVKNVDPSTIKVGDPITYKVDDDTMVTHRVVSIDETNRTFETKGDANNTSDGNAITYAEVVGAPIFTIPLIGYLGVYLTTKSGYIILVTAVIVILMLTFLPDILLKKDKDDKDQSGNENKK